MLQFFLFMILVIAFTSPVAAEESPACSLLTSSDIEAATGGKVSAAQPLQFDDIPSGQKVVKVFGCMWGLSDSMGQLSISWFRGPLTDEEIVQLIKMSKNNVGMDDIRKANYKEVSKDFPNAWCSNFTPPASEKKGLILSSCVGGVKKHGLSMTFVSPTTLLTIDKAKSILDKAGERAK